MPELLCTPERFYLYTHTLHTEPCEGVLDDEGRPDYRRLFAAARRALARHRVRGSVYLALSPDLLLLHEAPFPSFEGFPLDEAILAEAQRNPFFRDLDLVVDYDLLRPEGPARVWVLFSALPRDAARRLTRGLRARRIEPWPLALWRAAKARYGQELRYFVLESVANTLAAFEGERLVGFRRLTRPVAEGGEELAEEVLRSLQLFGTMPPADRALVFGLPESPAVEGLPAGAVESGVPFEELKRAAWAKEPPFLDLRPRRTHLGEGMPPAEQRALFLSALLVAAALAAGSYLGTERARRVERVEELRAAVEELEAEAGEAAAEPLPTGPGARELREIALGLPKGLWLTELSAARDEVLLTGRAESPYLPLELAERLDAELSSLARSEEGLYDWEVRRALAPEAR